MKILALDCATKTGWCIIENGKIIESGVQDFSKRRGESNGIMFIRFRKWLNDIMSDNSIKMAIYEQAHHRGGAATEVCVGLTTRVQEECERYKIEYANIKSTELKKYATGKGNAGKPAMIAAAGKILMRDPIDDNEADAVCLAVYADKMYGTSIGAI